MKPLWGESRRIRETGAGSPRRATSTDVQDRGANAEVGATANKRRMKIKESGEDRLRRNGSSLYSFLMGSTNEGG